MGIDRIGGRREHGVQLLFRQRVEAEAVGGFAADEVDEADEIGIVRRGCIGGKRGEEIERWARKAAGNQEAGLHHPGQPRRAPLPEAADRLSSRGAILSIDRFPGRRGKRHRCRDCSVDTTPLPSPAHGHCHGSPSHEQQPTDEPSAPAS